LNQLISFWAGASWVNWNRRTSLTIGVWIAMDSRCLTAWRLISDQDRILFFLP